MAFLALIAARWAFGQPEELPEQYRWYFVHYVDHRSLPEKALNLLGLTSQDAGRSFALVAGVDTYPSLPGADRRLEPAEVDLANLVSYLKEVEFFDEIVVLRNSAVTDENFKVFLQSYFPARLKKYPKSRFIFAYSGHGLQDGRRGYLLQSSATSFDDKVHAISMESLRVLYSEVTDAAFHSLALVNACHSGGFGRLSFGGARLVPREPGAHVITSGGTAEKSWHHESLGFGSVFFEIFFDGLGGRADSFPVGADGTRGDGVITVEELYAYLKPRVQAETDQVQNPILGDMALAGSKGSFFFLNRARQIQAKTVHEWRSARRSMGEEPPQAAREPVAGDALVGPLGMRFRFVPSGRYTIGSPAEEPGRFNDEILHEVELTRGFWVGETEVTQGQWQQLVGRNPSDFVGCGTSCPVEDVNWHEAAAFANLLSDREGLERCFELERCQGTLDGGDYQCESGRLTDLACSGYRLPTEAEWEVAARGGMHTAIYTGLMPILGSRNAPVLDPIAWYAGNSGVSYPGAVDCAGWPARQYERDRCGTSPVAQKEPNAWELHDMMGNVYEWCADIYGAYSLDPQRDPTGGTDDADRVIRGGSWKSDARDVRAAFRGHYHPVYRLPTLGFRLARGQGPVPSQGGGAPN